jgi:hypothetical protein
MPFLVAVVVILAVLCVLNMALSAAIIRTLRGDREVLEPPAAGTGIGAFTVPMLDGGTLTERDLADGALVAFVSPTCPPCAALAREWGTRTDLPEDTYVFVIDTSTPEEARAYAAKLGGRAAVVERDSAVSAAFGAHDVTPTLVRVRGGAVAAAGFSFDAVLPDRVAVAR